MRSSVIGASSAAPHLTVHSDIRGEEPQPLSMPEEQGSTSTLVEERPQTSHGDGDHDRFAHYVRKEKIVESAVTGTPVVALCGKVWVPSRDPQRYPVCPVCKEIFEGLAPGGNGEGDD
jgi:hypothetical protein